MEDNKNIKCLIQILKKIKRIKQAWKPENKMGKIFNITIRATQCLECLQG